MKNVIKIWGRSNSINVQKVMWTIGELDLGYQRIDVGGQYGGLDGSDFGALNPNRRIPVIEDEDMRLWESNAIVRYLAEKYGANTLLPPNLDAVAIANQWMDWQQTTLAPEMRTVFWGLIRTLPKERNHDAIRNSIENLKSIWSHLDLHLGDTQYVAGDRLTIGDIPVGAMYYRYCALDIEHAHLEHLASWYSQLKDRKAFVDYVMLPLT